MTDFIAATTSNSQSLSGSGDTNWQKCDYSKSQKLDSQRHEEPTAEIDLREALERILLGDSMEHSSPEPDDCAHNERRLDLLMWIMNLELRLSPYTEPA